MRPSHEVDDIDEGTIGIFIVPAGLEGLADVGGGGGGRLMLSIDWSIADVIGLTMLRFGDSWSSGVVWLDHLGGGAAKCCEGTQEINEPKSSSPGLVAPNMSPSKWLSPEN